MEPIALYDGPAPGSEDWTHSPRRYHSEHWATEVVTNVVVPTITPVLPDGGGCGAGVIVAPGGAFVGLSIASEGFEVAERLAAAGIAAFVLEYRLLPGGDDPVAEMVERTAAEGFERLVADMAAIAPLGGADGIQAMRVVRSQAAQFGIDDDRLGFMGFSAGGNVAMRVAFNDDAAARPNFVAPIYASMRGLDVTVPPSGSGPAFVVVATDDGLGLADDSVEIYQCWRQAGLAAELHAYARGGHGFGMRVQHLPSDTWLDRFLEWFEATGLRAPA